MPNSNKTNIQTGLGRSFSTIVGLKEDVSNEFEESGLRNLFMNSGSLDGSDVVESENNRLLEVISHQIGSESFYLAYKIKSSGQIFTHDHLAADLVKDKTNNFQILGHVWDHLKINEANDYSVKYFTLDNVSCSTYKISDSDSVLVVAAIDSDLGNSGRISKKEFQSYLTVCKAIKTRS